MGASAIKWVISTQSDEDGAPSLFLVKAPEQGPLEDAEQFETESDAEHVTAVLDNPESCRQHPIYIDADSTRHLVSETAAFTVIDLLDGGYSLDVTFVDDDVQGAISGPDLPPGESVTGTFDEVVTALHDRTVQPQE